jgi:hypothetical protein
VPAVVQHAHDHRAVHVAVEEAHQHFLADAWQELVAEPVARAGQGDPYPGGCVRQIGVIAIGAILGALPMEADADAAERIGMHGLARRAHHGGALRPGGGGAVQAVGQAAQSTFTTPGARAQFARLHAQLAVARQFLRAAGVVQRLGTMVFQTSRGGARRIMERLCVVVTAVQRLCAGIVVAGQGHGGGGEAPAGLPVLQGVAVVIVATGPVGQGDGAVRVEQGGVGQAQYVARLAVCDVEPEAIADAFLGQQPVDERPVALVELHAEGPHRMRPQQVLCAVEGGSQARRCSSSASAEPICSTMRVWPACMPVRRTAWMMPLSQRRPPPAVATPTPTTRPGSALMSRSVPGTRQCTVKVKSVLSALRKSMRCARRENGAPALPQCRSIRRCRDVHRSDDAFHCVIGCSLLRR